MAAETEALKAGKLHKLSTGKWFVHCKWCETEMQLEARNEEEAYAMLEEWRLSMPHAKYTRRNWSCPKCVDEYWKERDQRRSDTARSAATDTAGSAGQLADAADAAATPFDALKLEVVELKAEVVELKAEVERLRGEVHAHYAHVRERDEQILARALQMVRREVTAARKSPHPAEDWTHDAWQAYCQAKLDAELSGQPATSPTPPAHADNQATIGGDRHALPPSDSRPLPALSSSDAPAAPAEPAPNPGSPAHLGEPPVADRIPAAAIPVSDDDLAKLQQFLQEG